MDKAKVITAYLKGFITLKECEQILGMDASFIMGMVQERRRGEFLERPLKSTVNP